MEKPRAALWLWYRGDRFAGFQAQQGERTVQQSVREALVRAGARDVVMPAGRTDRGVHARMQVLSVRTSPEIARSLDFGEERDALGVVAAASHAPSFHALWSAVGRTYRFRLSLDEAEVPSAWAPFVWSPLREHASLAVERVRPALFREALSLLPGVRTFRTFHRVTSVEKPRTLHRAAVTAEREGVFEVELSGDAFGRHQARELVGACVAVAAGTASVDQLRAALEREAPFPTLRAPAKGLVLWEVTYPPALDPFDEPARREAASLLPAGPPFCAL